MLKYLTKFTVDILPSVAATVIGAYIVNHYIATKPSADTPAAAVSTTDPKYAAKPAESSADVGSIPAAGVKAKGISEKAMIEKTASERPATAEKSQEKPQEKSQEKSSDKSVDQKSTETKPVQTKPADPPVETASIPAQPRRHAPAQREKEKVRVVLPSPVQPVGPAVAAAPNPAPAAEAAVAPAVVAPEERRDATDLARAAIERLRGIGDGAARPQQEAVRAPEPPRAPDMARAPEASRVVAAPMLRPLPPPIMVSTPPSESFDQGSQPRSPYAGNAGIDDPRRPIPPADIPLAPRAPLDLHAETSAQAPAKEEHTTVADDMLSAAKSVFHAVLPK